MILKSTLTSESFASTAQLAHFLQISANFTTLDGLEIIYNGLILSYFFENSEYF
jgi:hypothetical protein